MIEKICISYLIVINIAAFVLFGVDKIKAVAGKWRITELSLIVITALGGCYGAFLGMRVWHHKTRKLKFQVLVPLFVILWTALILRYYGII